MSKISKFEDIEAWQRSRLLSQKIYSLTDGNAFKNDTRLKVQMNGSAGSLMDNIAEGFGRGGNKEFIQFLWISKGSASELKSQLYRCLDRKWVDNKSFDILRN